MSTHAGKSYCKFSFTLSWKLFTVTKQTIDWWRLAFEENTFKAHLFLVLSVDELNKRNYSKHLLNWRLFKKHNGSVSISTWAPIPEQGIYFKFTNDAFVRCHGFCVRYISIKANVLNICRFGLPKSAFQIERGSHHI